MLLRDAKVVYTSRQVDAAEQVDQSSEANKVLSAYGLHDQTQEHFVVIHLDTRHRVLSVQTVAVGPLGMVVVHPREVFRGAMMVGAAAVIVAHNHPSGDCEPSGDDVALTNRLKAAGELVGIPVLDHLIVGGDSYESLAERMIL